MTHHRRVMWGLFLFFQALYGLTSSGNAFRVPDEFEVYYQAEHLVDAGDLSVPQTLPRHQFFGRIGRDGKPYAPYGPLAAVLAVPHHFLARAIVRLAGVPRDTTSWGFLVSGLTMLTTATGSALAVVGFYRAAILLGSEAPTAVLLSLLLGGCTVLWTYGTNLFSEGWQAAGFIWAAVFLLERRAPLAALLLCLVGLTKVTSLVLAPGFLAAVLADRSTPLETRVRATVVLTAGLAAAALGHIGWNLYRFDMPFEFGYDWSETVPVLPAQAFRLQDLPRGLAVLLLSPGKSLLLWAPALYLSLTRIRTCSRPVLIGVLTSLATGLLFYGAYLFPEGGYSHGPRHLVPIVPLLLLPAATPGPRWRRSMVVSCAVIGFAMALLSVSVSFLQDQTLGQDFTSEHYYERIEPAPGRAWNRYRLTYVPFARTLESSRWPKPDIGTGLDFFWVHAASAKATLLEAQTIPAWLIWGVPAMWTLLMAFAIAVLWREPSFRPWI